VPFLNNNILSNPWFLRRNNTAHSLSRHSSQNRYYSATKTPSLSAVGRSTLSLSRASRSNDSQPKGSRPNGH